MDERTKRRTDEARRRSETDGPGRTSGESGGREAARAGERIDGGTDFFLLLELSLTESDEWVLDAGIELRDSEAVRTGVAGSKFREAPFVLGDCGGFTAVSADRDRAFLQGDGLVGTTHAPEQHGEVVERLSDVGVRFAEGALTNGERALVRRFGVVVLALRTST